MAISERPSALAGTGTGELPLLRTEVPGPMSLRLAARQASLECPAFAARRDRREELSGEAGSAAPIVLAEGRGANVVDVDGNRFVDLVAGFGSLVLGHAAPSVVGAASGQAERLPTGLGDVYATDAKIALLERLARLRPGAGDRVLFGQSGSDAVTAAIKTATLATGRPALVAFEGSYHGLGYAPLAACGLRPGLREPFAEQLSQHVRFVPYPRGEGDVDACLSALEAALAPRDVAAVLVEPVLGRGGCVVPPDGFLRDAFALAARAGALSIADEIWTGMGRSGALLRTEALGLRADVVVLGKGLGGGFPISACLAPEPIMRAWAAPGRDVVHTSTHVASPVACAAASACLSVLGFKHLPERAAEAGALFRDTLTLRLAASPRVREVRGVGLMIGVELATAADGLRAMAGMLRRGWLVLTGGRFGETLTLTPPLDVPEELLDAAATALAAALAD